MINQENSPIVVGVTGASGAALPRRVLRILAENGVAVRIIISRWADEVAISETGESWDNWLERQGLSTSRRDWQDLSADIASGSYPTRGMAVLPCSMGTLGGIASGISRNLIERAADVALKERNTMVLVPRETPLGSIHLQNMLAVSQAGGVIMPPMFSFYTNPESIEEMLDQFAYRVLKCFGIVSENMKVWGA